MSGGFATLCVCIMFLTPILNKRRIEDDFALEYSRKSSLMSQRSTDSSDSKRSSSSKDSGIGLQKEIDSCSSASSSSRMSSISDYVAIDIAIEKSRYRSDIDDHEKGFGRSIFDSMHTTLEKEFMTNGKSQMIVIERETVL